MLQIAKPGADRYRILVVYVYYFVQAIAISIVYWSLLGWVGVAVGTAFLLGLVSLIAFSARRFPRLMIAEVGNTRIEAKAGSGSGFSRKAGMTGFVVCAAVFSLGVILQAIGLLQDYVTSGSGEGLDWMPMFRQLTISIICLSNMYLTIRNRRRLLFTEQGLFQVSDPNRLWTSDRDLDEANSPLRAVRLYSWEQISRFHWSRQSGEHVLHLNVHQPGFGVPQLVSFQLRNLPDEGWQKLDQLLQTHVLGTYSQDPGRALTTSAAV
jgi:hypothetical protein